MEEQRKKRLGYIGKAAATIACPPIGGFLWPKELGAKFGAAIFGVFVSTFLSIGIVNLSDKVIYDNPKIKTRVSISSILGIPEAMVCPIGFYAHSQRKTTLDTIDEKRYFVDGDDVISFNNGKYVLNFGPEKDIGMPLSEKSVKKAEELVKKCAEKLEESVKQGSLFGARKAVDKLYSARDNLKEVTKEYNETKQIFQDAVNKMNSELGRHAGEIKG